MAKNNSPTPEIKVHRAFNRFIEKEAIAYFDDEVPVKAAFKAIAHAVDCKDHIKELGSKISIADYRKARAAQIIDGMKVVKRHKALNFLDDETLKWSSGGSESRYLAMLFTQAKAKDELAVVKILKDIDSSRDQLSMVAIHRILLELVEQVLIRLREVKNPKSVDRLKNKVKGLGRGLQSLRLWVINQRELSRIGKRFLIAMLDEIPASKITLPNLNHIKRKRQIKNNSSTVTPDSASPVSDKECNEASPVQNVVPAAMVLYSKADTPSCWAKKFNMSWKTLKRRFLDGTIKHIKLSTKLYRIAIDQLPATDVSDK